MQCYKVKRCSVSPALKTGSTVKVVIRSRDRILSIFVT